MHPGLGCLPTRPVSADDAATRPKQWVSLRQESSRKDEEARTQNPFVATLRVNDSRTAEFGQSAFGEEASLGSIGPPSIMLWAVGAGIAY